MRTLMGMKVIIKNPTVIKQKRSWKERLFTRPWKPFKKYEVTLEEMVKDGEVIKMYDSLMMNHKTYNIIKDNVTFTKKSMETFNFLK